MEIKSQSILNVFNALQTNGMMKRLQQRDQAMLYRVANEAVLVQLQELRGDVVDIIDRPSWREAMSLNEAKLDEDMREDEDDAEDMQISRNIFSDNHGVLHNVLTHQPEVEVEGAFKPLTEYAAFYAEEVMCDEAESMIENSRDFAANWATAEQLDQAWAYHLAMKAEYAELFAHHKAWRITLAASARIYSE